MFANATFIRNRSINLKFNDGDCVIIDGDLRDNNMTNIDRIDLLKQYGPCSMKETIFVASKSDRKHELAPLIQKLGEGCNKTVTKMNITKADQYLNGKWTSCTYFGNNDFAICGSGDEVVSAYTKITNEWLNSFDIKSKCDKC